MNADIQCPFEGWTTVREIGHGSYGTVYLIERTVNGETIRSAMKKISIPASAKEADNLIDGGQSTREELVNRYRRLTEAMQSEIRLMYRLRGNSHIVSYEDHCVKNHASGMGADIYIRMEYLTPLETRIKSDGFTYRELVQLGIDLCDALQTCAVNDTVHCDIKPDNVLVNGNGDYKLGDFGIARRMSESSPRSSKNRPGAQNFTAPEVYQGNAYSALSDLYSVGLILYRLMNAGRIPFSDAGGDDDAARMRRLSGEELPPPVQCDPDIWPILKKACAAAPADRYECAAQMKDALRRVAERRALNEKIDISFTGEGARVQREDHTPTSNRAIPTSGSGFNRSIQPAVEPAGGEKTSSPKRPKALWIILATIVIAAVGVVLVLTRPKAGVDLPVAPLSVVSGQAETNALEFTIEYGVAPYQVRLTSGKLLIGAWTEDAASFRVAGLAPHTAYQLSVVDAAKQEGILSLETPEVALYDESAAHVLGAHIYRCDRLVAAQTDFLTLIEQKSAKVLEDGCIFLRNATVEAQQDLWFVEVLTKPGSSPVSEAKLDLVIRLADGSAVSASASMYGLNEGYHTNYVSLDPLLLSLYRAQGGWLQGNMLLELYMNGDFVREIALTVTVSGFEDKEVEGAE